MVAAADFMRDRRAGKWQPPARSATQFPFPTHRTVETVDRQTRAALLRADNAVLATAMEYGYEPQEQN